MSFILAAAGFAVLLLFLTVVYLFAFGAGKLSEQKRQGPKSPPVIAGWNDPELWRRMDNAFLPEFDAVDARRFPYEHQQFANRREIVLTELQEELHKLVNARRDAEAQASEYRYVRVSLLANYQALRGLILELGHKEHLEPIVAEMDRITSRVVPEDKAL